MTADTSQNIPQSRGRFSNVVLPQIVRWAIIIVLDVATIWYLTKFVALGYYPLSAAIFIIVIFVNFVLLRNKAYPVRWMLLGLILMALFTIYPIFFTVWVAFTNYGEGHLITKEQAIDQILKAK